MQSIIYTSSPGKAVTQILSEKPCDKVFILTDDATNMHCKPLLLADMAEVETFHINIPATDANKTLESLTHVWHTLGNMGATRHSLMICLGGGMVTDLGGFAAATFKRSIRFINIPTTLLAMVDASVGGKTGINFNGLKNEIGAFAHAEAVIINPYFLKTLDTENILSGYAEMLKHALLSDTTTLGKHMSFDWHQPSYDILMALIKKNVEIKKQIVEVDPTEKGLRKALNLAHTTAHAFESLMFTQGKNLLHGHAVAWGIVGELFLSAKHLNFPTETLRKTICYIRSHYPPIPFECKHYEQIYAFMTHDKKNQGSEINFTLLSDVGQICINQQCSKEDIFEMLDFIRES